MNKLDEWKKLIEKTSDGPWVVKTQREISNYYEMAHNDAQPEYNDTAYSVESLGYDDFNEEQYVCTLDSDNDIGKNNAQFIAASKEAVPILIECLELAMSTLDSISNKDLYKKVILSSGLTEGIVGNNPSYGVLRRIREKLDIK